MTLRANKGSGSPTKRTTLRVVFISVSVRTRRSTHSPEWGAEHQTPAEHSMQTHKTAMAVRELVFMEWRSKQTYLAAPPLGAITRPGKFVLLAKFIAIFAMTLIISALSLAETRAC